MSEAEKKKKKNVRKSTPTLFNVLKDTGRIGKRIITAMRQSHVPHPELVVHSQNCFAPVSVLTVLYQTLFFRTTTDLPPREFPSMCAPSNPKRLAILPCFIADSTWSAVRASANVSPYLEMRLLDTSSCSRASRKWITGLVERGGKGGGEIWDLTRLELQK